MQVTPDPDRPGHGICDQCHAELVKAEHDPQRPGKGWHHTSDQTPHTNRLCKRRRGEQRARLAARRAKVGIPKVVHVVPPSTTDEEMDAMLDDGYVAVRPGERPWPNRVTARDIEP